MPILDIHVLYVDDILILLFSYCMYIDIDVCVCVFTSCSICICLYACCICIYKPYRVRKSVWEIVHSLQMSTLTMAFSCFFKAPDAARLPFDKCPANWIQTHECMYRYHVYIYNHYTVIHHYTNIWVCCNCTHYHLGEFDVWPHRPVPPKRTTWFRRFVAGGPVASCFKWRLEKKVMPENSDVFSHERCRYSLLYQSVSCSIILSKYMLALLYTILKFHAVETCAFRKRNMSWAHCGKCGSCKFPCVHG